MSIPVGTISHGTLRTEDLLKAAITALTLVDFQVADTFEELAWAVLTAGDDEDAVELLVQLEDEVNDRLPKGYYYGGLEGDPSDVGIWPVDEDE